MFFKVLKDCLPTVFSLMMMGLYGVIDGLFIGNTSGDIGLAAINIAWPITAFITATGTGIGIGGSILISHRRGQGKTEESNKFFHITCSLLLTLAIAITLILLPTFSTLLTLLGAKDAVFIEAKAYSFYIIIGGIFQILGTGLIPILRNFNKSFAAMVCMVTGTLLNILINYILIVHYGMGIKGAAIGTIVSQFVVSVMAIYIFKKQLALSFHYVLSKSHILEILKVSATAFGISIAPSITLLFANFQCLAYGEKEAVACYAVIAYVASPSLAMLSGIGEGTQPLMSYYRGVNDLETLQKIVKIARTLIAGSSLCIITLILVLLPHLGGWFGLSPQGLVYFKTGMTIYALTLIIAAFAKFNLSYLNATLQTKKSVALTYLESLVISPIYLFLLPSLFKINGIWLAHPLTFSTMIILYLIFIHKKTPSLS